MGPLGAFPPEIRFSALYANSGNFRHVGYLAPFGDLRKQPTTAHKAREPQGRLMARQSTAAMPGAEVVVAQDGARREPRREPRSSHGPPAPPPSHQHISEALTDPRVF